MPHKAFENRRVQVIECGSHLFRNAIRSVLRHFDLSSIDSIADSIGESIAGQGMRFASAHAFLIPTTPEQDARPAELQPIPAQEIAAAYLLEYPGKLASLVGPWVRSDPIAQRYPAAAREVLSLLIDRARDWGVELVQSVIDEDSPFPTEALSGVGLSRLSTLHQMAVDLPSHLASTADVPKQSHAIVQKESLHPPVQVASLWWKRYSPVDEAVWVDWMDATYEQTADCPELNGLRTTAKTLEGYLATSNAATDRLETPEWWGALERGESGNDAGLREKLVAAFMLSHSGEGVWELSYMGVAMGYRGRGLGKETLCRAMRHAEELNAKRLTLAVDSRNSLAIRLYREYGFQRIRQLEAWFLAFNR